MAVADHLPPAIDPCGAPPDPPPRGSADEDEVRDHLDRAVLESVRTLCAWFAPLMVLFAGLDWYFFGPGGTSAAEGRLPSAAGMTAFSLAAAGALAGVAVWLRRRPPPPRAANPIAIGVGLLGLSRALTLLYVEPDVIRAFNLAVLIVGAGCVLLSPAWLATYVIAAAATWYAVAVDADPNESWQRTVYLVSAMSAVSAVVLTVRRRSHLALIEARRLDRKTQREAGGRARIGAALSVISTRFVTLQAPEFDRAVERSLKELGELLGADHACLNRIDGTPPRLSVTHEWAAPGTSPRGPALRNVPLSDVPFFARRLAAGEPIFAPDSDRLPPEAAAEKAILERLGTTAFLAVPLFRSRAAPWGYLALIHETRPRYWTADEVNLLRVVGDIMVSATERQRAERALRQSESKFRRLFDANIIGVFFADVYGRIADANGAFFQITGYEPVDLPLRWNVLTPPEWRAHDEAAVLRLLKDGVDPPWEKEWLRKDGRRIPILIGGAVLSHDRGECIAFVLDLSDRKEAERKIQGLNAELEHAARLGTMGEMAAGVAHEVRQPLGVIANYANAARRRLQSGKLSAEQLDDRLQDIVKECDRASAVIDNIREFVRDRNPVRTNVDLNRAIRQCLQLTRFEIRQAGVSVETALEEGLPPVLTDEVQLSQVLVNLILNAVQAMEASDGPRRLRVATRTADPPFAEAAVTDTGTGISPEARDRLFDQFFTTKKAGLGMGLAIARSIAEAHGGTLTLAETAPTGTTFVLRLPFAVERRSGEVKVR